MPDERSSRHLSASLVAAMPKQTSDERWMYSVHELAEVASMPRTARRAAFDMFVAGGALGCLSRARQARCGPDISVGLRRMCRTNARRLVIGWLR